MRDGAGREDEAAVLHCNRLIGCMDEVMGLAGHQTEPECAEAGPGCSMANCVTQRKPGLACSQPLRSGGAVLKPFRTT